MYLSANVVSRIRNHRRAIERGSALVVIKLDGGRKVASKGSKIAPVICSVRIPVPEISARTALEYKVRTGQPAGSYHANSRAAEH